MGGVFMKKFLIITCICTFIIAVLLMASVVQDRLSLDRQLIRLHVVANSDSEEDQALKLQVRDRVLEYLQDNMEEEWDVQEAKAYLQDNLSKVEEEISSFLLSKGLDDACVVSLGQEAFGVRDYDTFSLPSGVYESLRITIGHGEGKNWWCVVFPRLCLPAVSRDFEETAVGAGFSNALVPTLQQKEGYEVRFFLLDVLGRIENFFFQIQN
jgi:stage II sporulation protein R